jgi:phosphatidylinositol-3-phosphatase
MPLPGRLTTVVALIAVATGFALDRPEPAATLPPPQRVAVLVLENRSYEQVIGNPAAPFLNRLAHRYALSTDYFALRHPSLPNYIALTGGDTNGIDRNCTTCGTENGNLVNQLDAAHVSWRAYFESLRPGAGLIQRTHTYNPHYNPFAYYERVAGSDRARDRVVNFVQLRRDLRRDVLPRFSWIAPNVFHDGHNASLAAADRYAAELVPRLLRELGPRGVLYVLWDEGPDSDLRGAGGGGGGGRIPLIAAGGAARTHARDATTANHYALLKTIETQLKLPLLGHAADSSTPLLSELVKPQ